MGWETERVTEKRDFKSILKRMSIENGAAVYPVFFFGGGGTHLSQGEACDVVVVVVVLNMAVSYWLVMKPEIINTHV